MRGFGRSESSFFRLRKEKRLEGGFMADCEGVLGKSSLIRGQFSWSNAVQRNTAHACSVAEAPYLRA